MLSLKLQNDVGIAIDLLWIHKNEVLYLWEGLSWRENGFFVTELTLQMFVVIALRFIWFNVNYNLVITLQGNNMLIF